MARSVLKIAAALMLTAGLVLTAPYCLNAASQKKPVWKQLRPGMFFRIISAEETVRSGGGGLAILRVNPELFSFRVLAALPRESGYTAGEWREKSGALAVVNAGQYVPDHTYLGLLVHDGIVKGRLAARMDGLFLSQPDDSSLPQARVLDLRYTAYDPVHSPYSQAAQSLMMLDRFGQIRVRKSARVAHRTMVAQDKDGWILVMITEGGHTLWELADFLSRSGLDLREVMCMDGGPEAQLDVFVDGFEYRQYGDPAASGDLPLPWPSPNLPAALGIFER